MASPAIPKATVFATSIPDRPPTRAQPGTELRWPASLLWRRGEPQVRKITAQDIWSALRLGLDDFLAMPTHALFLCLIYPVAGLVLYGAVSGYDMLPLIYPMTAGFALLGPVAAIGLYELSRRRAKGLPVSAFDALDVLHAPSSGAILRLGLVLAALFFAWLYLAELIYLQLFGSSSPASLEAFFDQLTTTDKGMQLFVVGNLVGFLFAAVVLIISNISFPMLVDRNVSAATAVRTSVRAAIENPLPIALWGLIVAGLLLLGIVPFFIGLTIILPVLGHATWHLYKKLVAPE